MVGNITKLALATVLAAPLMMAGGQAHATLIAGSASFADTGPAQNNHLTFFGTFNPSNAFSFNATNGTPVILNNFLTITASDSNAFSSNVTDTLSVTFNFTQPAGGSTGISGSGTASTFLGFITSGSITWSGSSTLTFADGDTITVSLSNGSFSTFSGADIDATITYAGSPGGGGVAAIPEPASIALFGAGLLGLGMVGRRRRRSF